MNPDKLKAPTLAEAGIDKKLANLARKLAVDMDDVFEERLSEWRDETATVAKLPLSKSAPIRSSRFHSSALKSKGTCPR